MEILRPPSRQPIPENAQKVFSGKLFDVYQWQQKQFDGTSTIFEKLKRPDTSYTIPITDDGKLIITKQKQPGAADYYGLIGGRINDNESPEQGARRELLEESGLRAGTLVLWDSFQFLPKIEWAIYIFIARGCIQIGDKLLDSGEQIELIKVSFDQFIQIIAQETFGDVEVALRVLRISKDQNRLDIMKKLFL